MPVYKFGAGPGWYPPGDALSVLPGVPQAVGHVSYTPYRSVSVPVLVPVHVSLLERES